MKNHIMADCAAEVGLDWHEMERCAGGAEADQLQIASASVCRDRAATYGTKG
jgi:hypothetical protein